MNTEKEKARSAGPSSKNLRGVARVNSTSSLYPAHAPVNTLFSSIPAELTERRQWVCYRLVHKGKTYPDGTPKADKIPCNPHTGEAASSTDPQTWGTFEDALTASVRFDGIGYVFSADDPYTGVDLDEAIAGGELQPWAAEIVNALNSYTEESLSGTGVHIILKATKPDGGCRTGKIEMYNSGRFFTFTGRVIEGPSQAIEERQAQLDTLHARTFPKPKQEAAHSAPAMGSSLEDLEIIEKATKAKDGAKFAALLSGDWSGYSSQSEADQALCNILAFWTGRDPERIDSLFRQSGLMRDKWDERRGVQTYGERTTSTAVAGCREVYQAPQSAPKNGRKKAEPASDPEEQPAPTLPGIFALTEIGNAERLKSRHGERIRYCHTFGCWYVWTGKRWERDTSGEVDRRAIETVRSIYSEAAAAADSKDRQQIADWAKRSERRSVIEAMIGLAESLVPIQPEQFDTSAWLLNCANGTIDLRTGELKRHNPADYITKLAPVEYHPDAQSPVWSTFLAYSTGGDPEIEGFLQRAAGYSLTGDTGAEALFFVHGPGAAGKSTFVESLKAILGDYAATIDFELLLKTDKTDGNAPKAELAKLPGARFVASIEVDEGKRIAEGLVKMVTGGDTISARAPYARRSTEFVPQFKLWLAANDAPRLRDNDPALWRRIHRVPFENVVPKERRDPKVKATLRDPQTGGRAILAWAVKGCLDWQRRGGGVAGLGVPAIVEQATDSLRAEMDPLRDFFADCCTFGADAWVCAADLRSEYERYCTSLGTHSLSGNKFGDRLRARGCTPDFKWRDTSDGRKKQRVWQGIGLLAETPDDDGTPVRRGTAVPGNSLHEESYREKLPGSAVPCRTGVPETPPEPKTMLDEVVELFGGEIIEE